MATQARSEHDLADILGEYIDAYRRRARKSKDGSVFERAEADLLVALFHSRRVRGHSESQLQAVVDPLQGATRRALTTQDGHSLTTDLAGFVAWDAYGYLPIPQPPVDQFEWVFDSGQGRGAIRGLFGVGWRVLFLTGALPYLSWPRRAKAEAELGRRLADLGAKLEGAADPAARQLTASQLARLAWVSSELATLVPLPFSDLGARLDLLAHERFHDVAAGSDPLPTGGVAQLVLSAEATGHREAAAQVLDTLIDERLDTERNLLWTQPGSGVYEMSPWVPLALLACVGTAPAPSVRPRRLRDLLRTPGRDS